MFSSHNHQISISNYLQDVVIFFFTFSIEHHAHFSHRKLIAGCIKFDLSSSSKQIKFPHDVPNELLYGRAGYLWACSFLNKHIGEGTIPSTYMVTFLLVSSYYLLNRSLDIVVTSKIESNPIQNGNALMRMTYSI